MHYFMQFAPRFVEWPLALVPAIKALDPDAEFSGTVSDTPKFYEHVKRNAPCDFIFLDHIDTLERQWISQPASPGDIQQLESRIDPFDLNATVIADRNVGAGYISGAFLPDTPLRSHCRSKENINQYLVGLYDWIEKRFNADSRPDIAFLYAVASATARAITIGCSKYGIALRTLPKGKLDGAISLSSSPQIYNQELIDTLKIAYEDPTVVSSYMPEARHYLRAFREKLPEMAYEHSLREKHLARLTYIAICSELLKAGSRWLKSIHAANRTTLRKANPVSLSIYRALRLWKGRRVLKNTSLYVDASDLPDGGFVYFPLHVNPEASTMVKVPMLVDQESIIMALAKAMPIDKFLVLKEHFVNTGGRTSGFYSRLGSIPNIVFANPFNSGVALTKKSAAVATITGTTGFEALMLGKPVLLIGDSEYRLIEEGLVHCSDPARFPDAVQKTLALKPASDERLLTYIATELKCSLPLKVSDIWGKVTSSTPQDNSAGLAAIAMHLVSAASQNANRAPN